MVEIKKKNIKNNTDPVNTRIIIVQVNYKILITCKYKLLNVLQTKKKL